MERKGLAVAAKGGVCEMRFLCCMAVVMWLQLRCQPTRHMLWGQCRSHKNTQDFSFALAVCVKRIVRAPTSRSKDGLKLGNLHNNHTSLKQKSFSYILVSAVMVCTKIVLAEEVAAASSCSPSSALLQNNS